MFLRKAKPQGPSAAWRIAIWPTVAFAVGSAVAFAIMYLLIAGDIRQRSDAWLSGEAEVLADVSENTPRDALYDRLVQEVAELASREVPDTSDAYGKHQASVFFLKTRSRGRNRSGWDPLQRSMFIPAVTSLPLVPGVPADVACRVGKRRSGLYITPRRRAGGCIWIRRPRRGANAGTA